MSNIKSCGTLRANVLTAKDLEQFIGKRVWVRYTRYVGAYEGEGDVFFIAVVRGLREDDGEYATVRGASGVVDEDDIGVVFEKEEVRVSRGKLVDEAALLGTEGEHLFASSIKGIGLCPESEQERLLLGELL